MYPRATSWPPVTLCSWKFRPVSGIRLTSFEWTDNLKNNLLLRDDVGCHVDEIYYYKFRCRDPRLPGRVWLYPPPTFAADMARGALGATDRSGAREHDLGNVLSHGQEITHNFTIDNPTDREVHVFGSDSLTPCCSSILEAPSSIPAHSRATLKVSFRPGFQSGWKGVKFVVASDGGSAVASRFSLRANLFSEVDVEEIGGTEPESDVGEPWSRTVRIVARRGGSEGRDAPGVVDVPPPFSARFVGPLLEVALPSGIVESSRIVEVVMPPSVEPGKRSVNLRARWPDGREWNHPLTWQVVAPIRVTPSGIVVRSTEGVAVKSFAVSSSKVPFRILSVESPFAIEGRIDSSKPSRVHVLRLIVDPARANQATPVDVKITTDHPHQKTLIASVLVLAQEREGSR